MAILQALTLFSVKVAAGILLPAAPETEGQGQHGDSLLQQGEAITLSRGKVENGFEMSQTCR